MDTGRDVGEGGPGDGMAVVTQIQVKETTT